MPCALSDARLPNQQVCIASCGSCRMCLQVLVDLVAFASRAQTNMDLIAGQRGAAQTKGPRAGAEGRTDRGFEAKDG